MDKRRSQRVVLIIGLLFLFIIISGIFLIRLEKTLQTEKERIIGQLITANPKLSADIIKAFENPDTDTAIQDIAAGREIEIKYGYAESLKTSVAGSSSITGALLLFLAVVLMAAIVIYYEHKQRKIVQKETIEQERYKQLVMNNQLLLERLAKEEQETKELVTDISHQLKTPLASLKMSYEIAQSEDFTLEEKKSFLQQGQEEIRKLEALLEALLNIARLEKSMIKITPQPAEIKKTLIAAVNRIYIKAQNKHIEIMMEESEELIVKHDTRWTQEALINILDNAVKYSKGNTTVRINITPMVTYVLIEIADEGIGIPSKDYPNIFKRFYRGNSEMVQKSEGSGVGLYLARKILEEQGGSICVKPGITCGSVFQITLPKA